MTPTLSRGKSLAAVRLAWRLGGVCAVVTMVAGWWLLVGQPLVATHNDLRRQLDALDALRSAEQAVYPRLAQVAANTERARRAEVARRERTAPQHDAAFLQWANQQAQSSGLMVRDFRPSGGELQGEYEGRGVMIAAQGSYESVCRFLDRLRDCPRMNRVTGIEITPRDAERATYAFTLQLLLFTHKPTQPLAAAL